MQHIDPELFTWLFIGAVGLVAGVWGLTRAASRRRGEAELSRLGKTSAAAPRRRERIAARRPDVLHQYKQISLILLSVFLHFLFYPLTIPSLPLVLGIIQYV